MDNPFDLEVGAPIERAVPCDSRVIAGVIPGGSYATLIHHEHPDRLLQSLNALETWGTQRGLSWNNQRQGADEVWGGRFEFYLTDPAVQPDPEQWFTEIAYLLKDNSAEGVA